MVIDNGAALDSVIAHGLQEGAIDHDEIASTVDPPPRYLFDRPRWGLLGRSVRYDLLPLSHA